MIMGSLISTWDLVGPTTEGGKSGVFVQGYSNLHVMETTFFDRGSRCLELCSSLALSLQYPPASLKTIVHPALFV